MTLNVTEYNTKNFRIEAKAHGSSRWLDIEFDGASVSLFFDTDEELDAALRALQSCSAPEPEIPLDSPEANRDSAKFADEPYDNEVPF